MSPLQAYLLLSITIIAEVMGTAFLVRSDGFTRLSPTLITLICYLLSFYLLAKIARYIPIGIAYAIWGGVGIALTALIGFIFFKQALDLPALIGIILIVLGVLIINLFSHNLML